MNKLGEEVFYAQCEVCGRDLQVNELGEYLNIEECEENSCPSMFKPEDNYTLPLDFNE